MLSLLVGVVGVPALLSWLCFGFSFVMHQWLSLLCFHCFGEYCIIPIQELS